MQGRGGHEYLFVHDERCCAMQSVRQSVVPAGQAGRQARTDAASVIGGGGAGQASLPRKRARLPSSCCQTATSLPCRIAPIVPAALLASNPTLIHPPRCFTATCAGMSTPEPLPAQPHAMLLQPLATRPACEDHLSSSPGATQPLSTALACSTLSAPPGNASRSLPGS